MLTLLIGNNSGWASIFDMVHGKPKYLDLSEEFFNESWLCWLSYLTCTGFLQHNCIQTISMKVFGLCKLQKSYRSHKYNLKPGMLRDLHKLKWLRVPIFSLANPIMKISQQLLFTGWKSLFFGSMINNPLETLPQKICTQMPLINWMDFEGNHIKALTNTTFLERDVLSVLFLNGNQICLLAANTFSSLKDLGELDLSSNMITESPRYLFKDMKYLQKHNLPFNRLSHHSEDHIESLRQLQSLYSTADVIVPPVKMIVWSTFLTENMQYRNKESASESFTHCFCALHVRISISSTDGISPFDDLLANSVLRVFVWVIARVTRFGNLVIRMTSFIKAENETHTMSIKILYIKVNVFCSVQKNALQTSEVRSHIRRDVAVANQHFFIVFTDAICWIPVFVIEILSSFQVEIPGNAMSV
ncbi:LOW QUALITY PROTEIN: relaxin receptor 2 [Cariama cristata]